MNRGNIKEHVFLTLLFTGSNIPFALASVKWQVRYIEKGESLYLSPLFISIARVWDAYFTAMNLSCNFFVKKDSNDIIRTIVPHRRFGFLVARFL